MAPTTLVTFLVRTPPSTRSVQLYGSWDNFSTSYPMQRDTRTGPEHWSGCHSFSNIICDGDLQVQSTASPRQGGLKMGGTYWYYYKLDDELEFHNSAEPSTTSCPLLPGQLVNVLNVPFALSSSTRVRNDSVSSTSSEHRTMEPTDKFLNPRPVPAKPTLPRLKTSPTLSQASWSSSTSPVSASSVPGGKPRPTTSSRGPSQPGSANSSRPARLAKMPSGEAPSRSASRGSNRSVGIIGAFRALKSPRLPSPDAPAARGRALAQEQTSSANVSRGSSARSVTPKKVVGGNTIPVSQFGDEASLGSDKGLALRMDVNRGNDDTTLLLTSSFAQHRRQRSSSCEPSPLHNSQSVEASTPRKPLERANLHYAPMETLSEVASSSNTPVWPITARKVEHENTMDSEHLPVNLEKRLPTLPNTPSSAYPPSSAYDSPQDQDQDDLGNLRSHFSATTIETESYTDSYIRQDRSRFSDWTESTTRHSPRSAYTSSIIDLEPMSPPIDGEWDLAKSAPVIVQGDPEGIELCTDKNHDVIKQDGLPSAFSFSTVSSVKSSANLGALVELDSAKDLGISSSKFQYYSLPTEDIGSGVTLKPVPDSERVTPLVVNDHHRAGEYQPSLVPYGESAIAHSTTMQQLLDELSYLGGVIQQH